VVHKRFEIVHSPPEAFLSFTPDTFLEAYGKDFKNVVIELNVLCIRIYLPIFIKKNLEENNYVMIE